MTAKKTPTKKRGNAAPVVAQRVVAYRVGFQTAQQIHEYLTSRPYAEVFQLVGALQASEPIHAEPDPAP